VSACENLQAAAQVGVALPRESVERIALAQQRGEMTGRRAHHSGCSLEDHVRQPGVETERDHAAPASCRTTCGVDGTQPLQQVLRLFEMSPWRRIQPGERGGIGAAPAGELECERREVRFEDLRRRLGRQCALLGLAPEAVAHTGRRATRAAATLVRGGGGDAAGLQPIHARVRIEARAPLEARVDDDADTFDGQAGLREVRCHHDLAQPRRVRLQGGVLCRRRQFAEAGSRRVGFHLRRAGRRARRPCVP